jgi:hypothetical protein
MRLLLWFDPPMIAECATMEIVRTGAQLPLLDADGRSGNHFRLGKPLPW